MASLTLMLAFGASFGSLAGARATPTSPFNLTERAPSTSKKVIVQMFEWSWDSIASECTSFLGPNGYGFVQGVGVIVDTIWNHMAGRESGTGVGGSSFTQYPNDDIVNYQNAQEVQTCELVNLADLATGTDYVRRRLAEYANDLLSLGADGLRLDAVKHIASGDVSNILSRLSRKPYITQEVIYGPGEPITPNEYTGNGDVQEFRWTTTIRDAFLNGDIASLQSLDNRGWVPGNIANIFVANHDTERGGSSLNINSPSNSYILATMFSLAHPYGTPTILSSYSFSDPDAGSPNNGYGTCSTTGGANGWLCQHRYIAISGMVGFYNAAGSNGLTNWYSPNGEPQRIAFGRGNAAFIAINNRNDFWSNTFRTSLPAGTYCDAVSGKRSGSGCTGATVTVNSDGSFTHSVYPRSAVAIHI
ncbi:hypothetical protein EST38_g2834 [Candolleomyces aberdarensis]|uniref:alpha-amylase n=1 Tax=Candolleomyces aberdarensis TaxID=2316362 RepID=A0A4Q2DV46_9AGAR|nr:hypothetical protein EST38_g2834 [Candolleomyces aberdarensis]